MKQTLRMFMLSIFAMLYGGLYAQTYTNETTKVSWAMDEPTNYKKSEISPDGVFNTVDVNLGDIRLMDQNGNENVTGTSSVSEGITFSQMRPTNSGSDYVTWLVKPMAGLTFTPKKITAYIVRFGTDSENGVVFSARVGTGDPITLGTFTAPRNNKSKADDKYGNSDNYAVNGFVEINLTEAQQVALTSADVFSLMGTIGVGNTKAGGIAKVTITGEVNGTIEKFITVYNIASSLYNSNTIIEGKTGTIAATTAEEAAKAPELKVDALNGKLGKNNADWAQINAGTIITLPGVPENAKVSFVLYSSTKLVINGVEYGNGDTYTATKAINLKMTCPANGYIQSITVDGTAFVEVKDTEGYTNTWVFGKSNGAPEFKLEKSAEYTYTSDGYSLIINTSAGKLNNASRTDQWAQCNNGTRFKVPVYAGSKVSWGGYNTGSDAGFTIDGKLYNGYYIATEEGTIDMAATGISYLSFIKIEPATLYEISGTINGGSIDGGSIILTAVGNKQTYSAVIASSTFTLKVPCDTYTLDLSEDVPYVVSSPENVLVNADGNIGTITITAAQPQTVTGQITNAPAEAFSLTFTGKNSHSKQVELAAGATSFEVSLDPDTYTISSSVGTLSALSKASFKVLKEAVTHNIYYPEASVPAATQQNITVDNTAAVAANIYNTLTDALAAAKAGNISSPVITLTSGQTYQEQVIVDMPNVTLKTSGEEMATITFYYGIGYTYYSLGENGYYDKDRANTRNSILMKDPSRWGATVLLTKNANNFKAENVIFENSFNQRYTTEEIADGVRPNGCQSITYDRSLTEGAIGYFAADTKQVTERAAAIAIENNPAGVQLYNCRFVGSQDTFYSSGKVYVKDCDIIGNTDYIFGGGNVVFDNCNLIIGGYSDKETSAYMTAQSGSTGDYYLFRDCTVKSSNRTYISANLGRDWGGINATVYYFNLKNEIGNKLSYKWTNMGGGIAEGKANLHIYDFDPTINANYDTTGPNGANINGLLSADNALNLYAGAVSVLGFTPERIYKDDVELDEASAYNVCRIAASNGVERNIKFTRSLTANQWNAITLPFAMTAEKITATFGEGVKVAELTSADAAKLNFTTITVIEANKPYIINVTSDFSNSLISAMTIAKGESTQAVGDWTATGIYTAATVPTNDYFFSESAIKKATDDTNAIGAFNVYFSNNSANDNVTFYVDGTPTSIKAINAAMERGEQVIYNLSGQRVNKATRGLYIINGRKVAIK